MRKERKRWAQSSSYTTNERITEYNKPKAIWFDVDKFAGKFFWLLKKDMMDLLDDEGYIRLKPHAFETICKNQLALFHETLTLLNDLGLISADKIKERLKHEKEMGKQRRDLHAPFRGSHPGPFDQLDHLIVLIRRHIRILMEGGAAPPTKTEIRARIIASQLVIERDSCLRGEKYYLTSTDVRRYLLGPINRRDTIAAMKRAAEIFPGATFQITKGPDNRNHACLVAARSIVKDRIGYSDVGLKVIV